MKEHHVTITITKEQMDEAIKRSEAESVCYTIDADPIKLSSGCEYLYGDALKEMTDNGEDFVFSALVVFKNAAD